jgi:hypothetical protein
MRPGFFGLTVLCAAFALLGGGRDARAQGSPGDELEEGYRLRTAGRCEEAIPHLVLSQKLLPRAKTLLNLADCEEVVHKLVDAERDWELAHDRAVREGEPRIVEETERRLAALRPRIAHVTIHLAPGVPPSSTVEWDGEPLGPGVLRGSGLLGVALPADPGTHVLTVRTPTGEVGRVEVPVAEGEAKEVEGNVPTSVGPVAPMGTGGVSRAPALLQVSATTEGKRSSPLRIVGVVLGGVGVASLVAGGIFGALALSDKAACGAIDPMTGTAPCQTKQDATTYSNASSIGNVSTAWFVAGGVLAAGGLTLYLVAPRSSSGGAARLVPAPGGAALEGAW